MKSFGDDFKTTATLKDSGETSKPRRLVDDGGETSKARRLVEQMDKALEDRNGAYPTRDVIQYLVEKFNAARGQAGKVHVRAKQVSGWLKDRLQKGKNILVPEKSNCTALIVNDDPSKIATINSDEVPSKIAPVNSDEVPSGWDPIDDSEVEYEARSSKDGAWYDVHSFRKHRILKSDKKEVRVRFVGFRAEDDEWVNVKNAVRLRSLPCEAFDCAHIMPGEHICCFKEGIEEAKYFDAHVLKIERKRHDVRGCRCKFLICYDHDQTEERVPLKRVYRRPEEDFIYVIIKNAN